MDSEEIVGYVAAAPEAVTALEVTDVAELREVLGSLAHAAAATPEFRRLVDAAARVLLPVVGLAAAGAAAALPISEAIRALSDRLSDAGEAGPTRRNYRVVGSVDLEHTPDVTVLEEYPAFTVVEASDTAAEDLSASPGVSVSPVRQPSSDRPVPPLPEPVAGASMLVVDLATPPDRTIREAIEAAGAEIVAPVDSTSLVVRAGDATASDLLSIGGITAARPHRPTVSLSPEVRHILVSDEPAPTPDLATALEVASGAPAVDRSPRGAPIPGMLSLAFFSAEDRHRAQDVVQDAGIEIVAEPADRSTRLLVRVTPETPVTALATMTRLDGLKSVEDVRERRLSNDLSRVRLGSQPSTETSAGGPFTGSGETIAVADTGLDTGDLTTLHPDLRGRVQKILSYPIPPSETRVHNVGADDGPADTQSGHGTHVAGSAAGNGSRAKALSLPIDPSGTAPEAQIVFQAIEQVAVWTQEWVVTYLSHFGELPPDHALLGLPADLTELFADAHAEGARIHTNSWGGGVPGAYDQSSDEVDRFMWEHPDMLILFAAGNAGSAAGPFIAPGSVDPPGTAKNCLTVGASENLRPTINATYGAWWPQDFPGPPFAQHPMTDSDEHVVAFSSRGPASTGRRKPDVIAPGTFVLSTRSSRIAPNNFAWRAFPPAKSDYMFMGGTSMATPLVAGCAARVRQYLKARHSVSAPSGALVKAALIHAADRLDDDAPHPDSAAPADAEQGWGEVHLDNVIRPAGIQFVENTDGLDTGELAVWSFEVNSADEELRLTLAYSDFPGANLINNLNLFALTPSEQLLVGNDATGNGTTDDVNNVEGIRVAAPETGVWFVAVAGSAVAFGPQPFALVGSGDLDNWSEFPLT